MGIKSSSRALMIFEYARMSSRRDVLMISCISLILIVILSVSLASASSAVAHEQVGSEQIGLDRMNDPGGESRDSISSDRDGRASPGSSAKKEIERQRERSSPRHSKSLISASEPSEASEDNPDDADQAQSTQVKLSIAQAGPGQGPNQPPVISSVTPNVPSPQAAGRSVTWTAQASDPNGNRIFYQFWLNGPRTGGIWVAETGWVISNTWTWTTTDSDIGTSQIRVWVRDGFHAGPDGYDSSTQADFTVSGGTVAPPNQPPAISDLAPDRPSPQTAGTPVGWTARAMDPDGDQIYYRFWLNGPRTGGAWSAQTDWTTSNTWTWTTNPADAGSSQIRVWVRDGRHSGPETYDNSRVSGFDIIPSVPVNQPPVVSALNSNRPSPQAVGTPVTWTAQASDPDGDQIYYQFWLNGPRTGGIWVAETGWTISNTWTWTATVSDVGQSQVQVWVRDGRHASPDSYDSNRVSSFAINRPNQPPAISSFSPDRPSPQLPGTWVKWTASARDPDGDLISYRFWLRGPSTGGAWADQSGGWTRSNSWIWRTSPADIGQSQIGVWIRDGHHAGTNSYDDSAIANFAIATPNQPPVLTGIGSSLQSPQTAGAIVRWVASARDPDGDAIYYRYMLRGPATGNSWRVVRDWSPDGSWSWATTPADVGQSQVQVWIRDGRHAGTTGWDDLADAQFTVLPPNRPPAVSALNPERPDPQPAGTPVTWTAQASDPDGDPIQYKFLLRGPSTRNSLVTVQDWSSRNSWTWSSGPGDAGDYSVSVYVRDGRHAGADGYDGLISASYSLVQPQAARKLTTGSAPKDRPSLAFTPEGYLLAYQTWENGQGSLGDVKLQSFGPGWSPTGSIFVSSGRARQDTPSVVFAGGHYYVAYASSERGNMDIFVRKYAPDLSLVETRQLTSGTTDQDSPSLISVGSHFFLAYQSWDVSGSSGVYVTELDQSWAALRNVQVKGAGAILERPSITFAGGNFYVAYASDEAGNMDVYIRRLDASLNPQEIRKMTSGPGDHHYPSLAWLNGQFILLYSTMTAGSEDIFMERFYRDWTPIERGAAVTGPGDQTWPVMIYSPPERAYWLGYVSPDQEGPNIYAMPLQLSTTLKDCNITVSFSATRSGAPFTLDARFYNNYGELTDPSDLGISWSPEDAIATTGSGLSRISQGRYQLSSTFGSPGEKSLRIIASIDGCLTISTTTVRVF